MTSGRMVELLDQAEGMAHSQGQLDCAKCIERCNRMIEKVMSEEMAVLPDVCRLWTRNTDWDGHWPRFVERVGAYHLRQVETENSLPEASWLYQAECQLESMREALVPLNRSF